MGKDSLISWTDHTFNPWIGCTKVSPGCANCYADELDRKRFSKTLGDGTKASPVRHFGKGAPRCRTSEANWKQPRRWNADAGNCRVIDGRIWIFTGTTETVGQPESRVVNAVLFDTGRRDYTQKREIAPETWENLPRHRPRVFCASLADWLDAEVPLEWFTDFMTLVRECRHLDFLLLTKRPANWHDRIANSIVELKRYPFSEDLDFGQAATARWLEAWQAGRPPENVWWGTTVEDQERADERIPQLLSIPARVRFLSCEPLLGAVDLHSLSIKVDTWRVGETFDGPLPLTGINWVIIGGESGADARPFQLEHALDLVMQCKTASVPVFVKQLGAQPITSNANLYDWPDETTLEQHGTEAAGARVILRDRNGRDLSEWPEEFRVQEFPTV